MKYEAAKKILDYLEQYEIETGNADIQTFSVWLSDKLSPDQEGTPLPTFRDLPKRNSYDGIIAAGVGILFQHAKHYIKTALKGSPLVSIHDFAFLVALIERGDMRKKEIIDFNYLEFSPGMEVIRRLLRKGLIEEYNDPNDGRSKRIRISEKGKEELTKSYEQIDNASRLVGGNLSHQEKLQTIKLIQKLLHFHHPIWHEDFGQNLENITDKYLNDN